VLRVLQFLPVDYTSTTDAASAILRVLEDEEQRLSAVLKIERHEKNERTNEIVISLKKGGGTFRITFNWVRDEHVSNHGFHLGNGYIEKEWDLRLGPVKRELPVAPPFVWELRSHDESIPSASHPQTLTESWLRQFIQKKLAIQETA
jgi:hypothetical protein